MLYFIPTPIGNLGDITFRSLEILKESDIIFCEDVRICKSLLNLLEKRFNLAFKNKVFYSLHSHNENKFDFSKIDFSLTCAYLSDAGMPAISDPGSVLVQYAQKNNIEYYVLPGANAALCAIVKSGFLKQQFIFYGFLNIKKNRENELINVMNLNYPVILYEAPSRIEQLINQIAKINPDKELFLIKEITKLHEKHFKNKAAFLAQSLKNENLNGEWVVIINNENSNDIARICQEDILCLDIAPKIKAKLLSKINNKSIKENYESLKC
ncbi:16S rRNA (cytidine(1402)-2'-O)-methyltransferase [Campylobacter canadensis]|uniref:16S rRNA (Cytidine(1402)-2'-O)-methyltransferase n=1 Tax=Campylobacter canadensis TaxID=449520 RepID=A0ABS7WRT6_9BACT|nr:16S rRNA (cytidine(1402)-2'-O)-methyltransferase [Campylobacter canadensis]MBZ7987443.1 16S rRNA (cytidine(1402)-2'-O)-methyltransferase [Campylobacter canadensis]MBZ7995375.1 16S rRNA (cytidine(1402)-2'-O)-methyltransferase [Campylobacter canadensis]MBZ7996759.1 16S rRNA (cytidine(1402)-2'-O)-methyltransferase [Campylobacter canadensis]MBZ7998638.1 16S rRNA (cytidine(1402)-2'-O)-methyltransferase [Campylobacter canadensis]MBZ8000721.1 16S rRNA (cytidine(1402)-2'-O)-methyltransferase [Campy